MPPVARQKERLNDQSAHRVAAEEKCKTLVGGVGGEEPNTNSGYEGERCQSGHVRPPSASNVAGEGTNGTQRGQNDCAASRGVPLAVASAHLLPAAFPPGSAGDGNEAHAGKYQARRLRGGGGIGG